jgi:hypothetical protein
MAQTEPSVEAITENLQSFITRATTISDKAIINDLAFTPSPST